MARTKKTARGLQHKWVHHHYTDHAGQPAALLIDKQITPEIVDEDLASIPQFAFQVYSTIPLDPDHTALCQYLSREIGFWPQPSFEIYAPQSDVFACVEHQRREIAHRKNTIIPGEDWSAGIAKVVSDNWERLPRGFLLVIRSHSYRDAWRGPDEELDYETCPLWVNFNRCFPNEAEVDVRSRYIDDESELSLERSEIMIILCNQIFHMSINLKSAFRRSHLTADEGYDYGLDEDEGEPYSPNQPIPSENREMIDQKAKSPLLDSMVVTSQSGYAITIKSPSTADPDIRYIIHVAFPHYTQDLDGIARAFTSTILENLPNKRSIYLEFHTSNPSLSSIINSHREIISSNPEMTIGAMQTTALLRGTQPRRVRVFPSDREDGRILDPYIQEPYTTFIVILDRPDFLTAPGVLFLLTDAKRLEEDYPAKKNPYGDLWSRNIWKYQVWRSVNMPAVARRLAMLALEAGHAREDTV